MANAKRATLDSVGFPGAITVVAQPNAVDAVCVVDGQHRLGALATLVEEGLIAKDARMTVEVFCPSAESSMDLAAQVFTDINMAEPVKFCDLPNEIGRAHV